MPPAGRLQRRWRLALIAGFALWAALALLLMLSHGSDQRQQQRQQQPAASEQLRQLRLQLDAKAEELMGILAESRLLATRLHEFRQQRQRPQQQQQPQQQQRRQLTSADLLPADICVLVLACNRPTVSRSLQRIFRYRPAPAAAGGHQFPVVVSQDCEHPATTAAIREFGQRLRFVRQPDTRPIQLPPKERPLIGYYRIARHFRWALDHVFLTLNYSAVIVVEDDLDIAPDFFHYFLHLGQLLAADPSLWCVSAWNDNGVGQLVDKRRPDLFYRTDFFPGLGWMMLRRVWTELRTGWPPAYWDDHLRKASVRRGRSCIRPELSRSYTFGKVGVSHGQFFDKFLKFIHLSTDTLDYSRLNLTYLLRENYDRQYIGKVYSLPATSLQAALAKPPGSSVRIEYSTKAEFVSAANALGAMSDFKDGVARCAYRGVVSVYKSGVRVHLAPKLPWSGYDATWR